MPQEPDGFALGGRISWMPIASDRTPRLSNAQERVLRALVELCPALGHDARLCEVAGRAGLRPNAACLALGALTQRRLVVHLPADGGHESRGTYTPSYCGRQHVARWPGPCPPRAGGGRRRAGSGRERV